MSSPATDDVDGMDDVQDVEDVDGATGATGPLTLRELTAANRDAVVALAVTPAQDGFVADVAQSLVDAAETPDAKPWYRAVYAGDEPVGFLMLSVGITVDDPSYLGPYFLWRLLVDARHQGRGYGAAALRLAVEHVRTRPDARVLLTSCGQGPGSPLGFYLRQGFTLTGQVHEGEVVLELDLARDAGGAAR
jgi:diamine N-acetyltransferase